MADRHAGLAAVFLLASTMGARAVDTVPQPEPQPGATDTYLDDRSTPESIVRSLYNAVARREYTRAHAYFSDESDRPDFARFAKGYETTRSVRLKLGQATGEGAAGSIFGLVPAVIEARQTDGTTQVFSGCYETRLVQPAAQALPPFRPLQIVRAELAPASGPFDSVTPTCPDTPQ